MESKKRQRRDSANNADEDWEDVGEEDIADDVKPRKIAKPRKLAKDLPQNPDLSFEDSQEDEFEQEEIMQRNASDEEAEGMWVSDGDSSNSDVDM